MHRRDFIKGASAGAASLTAFDPLRLLSSEDRKRPAGEEKASYRYRIAFGAWINDMREDPLPLENWPAPQLDDAAVESAIEAMDVQAPAGFNLLDAWGLFATYGWPLDIASVLTDDRQRRIERLIRAARERGMGLVLGLGTYSWGYDKIIAADPEVRGKNPDGSPHPHALCDAHPRAFEYVQKIIDFALGRFDFAGVHLESCDLGCCWCPKCAGQDGVVGYNVRINKKTADYIKGKWPDKTVYVITINWAPAGKHFNAEEKAKVLDLGKHIDCLFDQGHSGYHIAEEERRRFIEELPCAYGTSGGLWLYPDARWDRESYFLPYTRRTGEAIRGQFREGVRGCMYYQGPVRNPGQELMIAFGGRLLKDPARSVDGALEEVLGTYYRPRSPEALQGLLRIFRTAEESYFGRWSGELFQKVWGIPLPGEFKLDQRLFGTSPGPATYLKEPCLDAEGRKEYRKGLKSILEEIPRLAGSCDDGGRLARIRRSAIIALNTVNTVCYCLGEPIE
ncbi:MAG: hypothetical protein HY717_15105 [Planctomycetes bacterium]|nr:hypothetical protein [Planctomycetota bacterium]